MITDTPPRKADLRQEYANSETLVTFAMPPIGSLRQLSGELEQAMKKEDRKAIQRICNAIAVEVSSFYKVTPPTVRIFGARPLEENGDMVDETYGDYDFNSQVIRLWMRTAVLEKVTSFGTLLSTLCHEICHHLDVVHLGFPSTFHTRGFYERAGLLYHHVRGTPSRKLVWDSRKDGTYIINWPQTMRGGSGGAGRYR